MLPVSTPNVCTEPPGGISRNTECGQYQNVPTQPKVGDQHISKTAPPARIPLVLVGSLPPLEVTN